MNKLVTVSALVSVLALCLSGQVGETPLSHEEKVEREIRGLKRTIRQADQNSAKRIEEAAQEMKEAIDSSRKSVREEMAEQEKRGAADRQKEKDAARRSRYLIGGAVVLAFLILVFVTKSTGRRSGPVLAFPNARRKLLVNPSLADLKRWALENNTKNPHFILRFDERGSEFDGAELELKVISFSSTKTTVKIEGDHTEVIWENRFGRAKSFLKEKAAKKKWLSLIGA